MISFAFTERTNKLIIVVAFFFCSSTFPADISNWNLNNSIPDAFGFFAHGADGVLHGIVLVLFIFLAFDVMIMCKTVDFIGLPLQWSTKPRRHRKIRFFGQTIERTIFLTNTILCLCSLGIVLASTLVQPIHLMVSFERTLTIFSIFFFIQKPLIISSAHPMRVF